jgi:UDP-2,3-diacylglucosamine pyrophosphatase LpxH
VEHGNQYDDWSSFHDLVAPAESAAAGAPMALPMGNLSCRYLINRIGTFNPHSEDFIRSGPAYVAHWLRYYAFSRHSLMLSWLWGSVLIVITMLRGRRRARHAPHLRRAHLVANGAAQGLTSEQVDRLAAGFSRPVSEQLWRLVRELWLDRLALMALMVGGTIALALTPIPLWVKLMVPLTAFPLTWFLWDGVFSASIFDYVTRLPAAARRIADVTGVAVVVMGHTHQPGVTPLDRGRTLANSGTWAPVGAGIDGEPLTPGKQNYVVVEVGAGAPVVRVGAWMTSEMEPVVVEAPEAEPALAR